MKQSRREPRTLLYPTRCHLTEIPTMITTTTSAPLITSAHCHECGDEVVEFCAAHPNVMIDSIIYPAPHSVAYLAAYAARVAADALDDATPCTCGPHDATCAGCDARTAYHAADRACDAARAAWLASDEPRDWEVRDDQAQDVLHDVAPADAEAAIEAWLTDGDWDTSEGPLYLTAYAYPVDPATGTCTAEGRVDGEVTIEQDAPDCKSDEEHDWCAPHSVLGGLRENPGVWGRGAGVVMRRVCSHCGAYQVYESARQDSGTGRYHEATSYEEPDDDSLEWLQSRHDDAMIEACPYLLTNHNRRGPGDYVVSVEVNANDDEACDAILAEIREAIGPGWSVEWTGNGGGNTSDIAIEREEVA